MLPLYVTGKFNCEYLNTILILIFRITIDENYLKIETHVFASIPEEIYSWTEWMYLLVCTERIHLIVYSL